ncbi:MAG TPA: hypothetical protein DDZ41_07460 [Flavobacterium sp.]|nr:hypothetical protein [Flavobacterium sp.]
MNTNSEDQEIDLGQLKKKIVNGLNQLVNHFFDFIFFLQKKIAVIILILAIGLVLAFVIDRKKNYYHEISVIPNFGSNEYLYKRIDEINTKIREKDPQFFKNLGISNFKDIISIEVEAYPAIYSFVNNKDQGNNFELIKLMAEDGNLEKILEDKMTSQNYYHHKISIVTKGMWNKNELIDPILLYLNSNEYFIEQKKVRQQNLEEKLVSNDSLIKQIDRIILMLSSNTKAGSSISISQNNSIPELVNKKDMLIAESQGLKTSKIIFDQVIKEESSIINIRDYKPLILNTKIILPLLLVFVYLLSIFFIKVYKSQKARIES